MSAEPALGDLFRFSHLRLVVVHPKDGTPHLAIVPKEERARMGDEVELLPYGGVTIARTSDNKHFGVAVCALSDVYDKNHGRNRALGRLMSTLKRNPEQAEPTITVPRPSTRPEVDGARSAALSYICNRWVPYGAKVVER